MDKLLHSIDETLETCDIGRTKFYELVAAGELKTVRIGRRRLVSHDELQRFVAALESQAASNHDHHAVSAAGAA
jgi:excisionase family DNA binding protein